MYYGFDMGGSKIEIGVFDTQLNRLWTKRIATPLDDYQLLLTVFSQLTQQADQHFNQQGMIGIGIPGLIDQDNGTVFTTNVPCAKNKTLQKDLEKRLGRPVKLDNDANCFALSEACDPEFRQYPSILGVILGTGLGGGMLLDGKLLSGRNGIASEIGHIRLPVDALKIFGWDLPLYQCGCGHFGCSENYFSGRGFEWLYHHFYHQQLSAKMIIQRYYERDVNALEHVERFMDALAAYFGNLFTLLDPHLVVIGGGLSCFDALYDLLPQRLPKYLFKVAKLPRIEKARYGDAGGVRGAAFLNLRD